MISWSSIPYASELDDSRISFKIDRRSVRGVALLSDYGDTVYKNAPFQTVKDGTPQEEEWNRLMSLDWSKIDLTSVGGGNDAHLMTGCDGLKCELPTSSQS
jgi:hypothetical protein